MFRQISPIVRHEECGGTTPLVGFQIGGAQKCGTNALFNGLFAQPGLALAIRKETRFFVDDSYFSVTRAQDEIARDYGLFFPTNTVDQVAGESTPEYMWHPPAAERIKAYNPKTKWVICLRNPIARVYSQWKMQIRNGFENRDFLTCLKASTARLERTGLTEASRSADPNGLLTRGLYVQQIDRLVSLFSEDQVYVLFTANLRVNFRMTVNDVITYLNDGLKARHTVIPSSMPNPGDGGPGLQSLALLQSFYAGEIDRLAEKTGCDLTVWRDWPLSD